MVSRLVNKMKCVLCVPLKWLGIELDNPCEAAYRAFLKEAQDRRYAQANDQDVQAGDPAFDALAEADTLWRRDPDAGFARLSELAAGGSVWAMMLTGWAYESGKGIAGDLGKAEQWYRLAFEGGSQQALLRLGRLYEERGDLPASENVYRVGVTADWGPAMYYLAVVELRQPLSPARLEEARALLERAAARGDLGAGMTLARLWTRGWFGLRGIPTGLRLAYNLLTKAGDHESTEAPENSAREEPRPSATTPASARAPSPLWGGDRGGAPAQS
jgi:TPR repeat protein